jgi:hypothetical protein
MTSEKTDCQIQRFLGGKLLSKLLSKLAVFAAATILIPVAQAQLSGENDLLRDNLPNGNSARPSGSRTDFLPSRFQKLPSLTGTPESFATYSSEGFSKFSPLPSLDDLPQAPEGLVKLAESLVPLFKANNTEVILYDILRPMESLSEVLVENRSKALALFEGAGINCRIVEEESNTVSFGFAKQTLAFANENKVDLIGIVPMASEEFTYMADSEKERFLTNDSGIPIWCCW